MKEQMMNNSGTVPLNYEELQQAYGEQLAKDKTRRRFFADALLEYVSNALPGLDVELSWPDIENLLLMVMARALPMQRIIQRGDPPTDTRSKGPRHMSNKQRAQEALGAVGPFTESVIDDPRFDGTDGAHPAWWRGCDHGVDQCSKKLRRLAVGEYVSLAYASQEMTAAAQAIMRLKNVHEYVVTQLRAIRNGMDLKSEDACPNDVWVAVQGLERDMREMRSRIADQDRALELASTHSKHANFMRLLTLTIEGKQPGIVGYMAPDAEIVFLKRLANLVAEHEDLTRNKRRKDYFLDELFLVAEGEALATSQTFTETENAFMLKLNELVGARAQRDAWLPVMEVVKRICEQGTVHQNLVAACKNLRGYPGLQI